jgi:hypothetical protein
MCYLVILYECNRVGWLTLFIRSFLLGKNLIIVIAIILCSLLGNLNGLKEGDRCMACILNAHHFLARGAELIKMYALGIRALYFCL